MIQKTITNEQKVKATLNPRTDAGKPVELEDDPAPKWSVLSGTATIVPSADGKSCDLVSGDTPGVSVILIEADADVGDGVATISDTIELTVEGALAANLGLALAAPELK